ncbi:helix-turn-helix domain-containing protein [Aquibaculum sediminis]|uniref:helix-turn-helix domain-containing protein n=1 Tax=Aquibaculum sediminis TaxID=3231907 RepID=UPI003455DD94
MGRDVTGFKIRTLRREQGLAQGELARRSGISPSYLNLIERNKRSVAGALLDRIADGLGVPRAALDGVAERRAIDTLQEIPADPALLSGGEMPGSADELVGQQPGWARLLIRLYQAYQDRNQAVLALADRMNRDPFLGDSVHRILTQVTSIRAAAEILELDEPLSPADRQRFLAIVSSDSQRLSQSAQALADFFDSAQVRVRSATPMEHVDAFILEKDNHFPELEEIATSVIRQMAPGESPAETLRRLHPALGSSETGTGVRDAMRPADSQLLHEVRAFVRHLGGDAIAALVQEARVLETEEARALATSALESYLAAAIVMPYDAFLEAAEAERYDLDLLMRRFHVSYEQAAHRLATLRRPDAPGVRFAFMRSDPSGYVTKRLPLNRLPLPRYGTACPLWVVYSAFQTPGMTVRNFGELPSGEQFLFFARAVEKHPAHAGYPRHLLSVMLACAEEDAHRVTAGDGIDRAHAMIPLGTVCRLCSRLDCAFRQEQPLIMQ